MSSRSEDAASLLLVDGVQAEDTLLEHELMLGGMQPPWALSQAATREECDAILNESYVWLQDEFPSRWWQHTGRKLEFQQQQDREHHVRDLREENERGIEALIVDRRILQREKATEVANIKLDIDVKLQRKQYERELDQLSAREVMENQRHASRRHKLTHKFEIAFVAQSGALMRRAARASVASSLEAQEKEQQRLTAAVKVREAEALARRRDAKSFWFVRNRQEKRGMDAVRQFRSAEADKTEQGRLSGRRQRIREDKDIKKMLNIV
ncbi:hypothetical protein BBJ29_001089 [Phytophthora kernoviae]|uniref:Uncharacterized protein n=1 Tax=Phytophthora kernoviae TaxID=325452 RepID=A0A3F2RWH4_9STRA|nr:hypothetical protein BBJ29_001089 [Phytophthora kernoviae]RLN65071.1 hypothetical protein BBP00_00003058 [Phytophthora kernoviae]